MLKGGYDYIFFVDNDVILPKTALVDLYNMDWYFTTGTYARKEPRTLSDKDPFTTLYNHDERNKEVYCPTFMYLSSLPPNKLTQVDCCGFGCALLRKDLFATIEQPWFFFAHEGNPKQGNWDEYCIGEDMYFCRKVIKKGLKIYAHGSVICGHLGKYVYRFPKRG
jgi:cellulose synthase/poly-beta-1,6-N-acetylglucosamine synthase-like glycosyltransferase